MPGGQRGLPDCGYGLSQVRQKARSLSGIPQVDLELDPGDVPLELLVEKKFQGKARQNSSSVNRRARP